MSRAHTADAHDDESPVEFERLLDQACVDMLATPRPSLATELAANLRERQRCSVCGLILPLWQFALDHVGASGHQRRCRQCSRHREQAKRTALRRLSRAKKEASDEENPDAI